MITCKSPVAIMRAAHALGRQLFDEHAHKFSRKDFTLAQLFACLALREHQKKSYRGVEALLADSPQWLADIGLAKAPDHNTLSRAFNELVDPDLANSMLDLMAKLAASRKLLRGDGLKPLTLDSSMYESRHVSRHFEQRQRDTARAKRSGRTPRKKGADRGTRG